MLKGLRSIIFPWDTSGIYGWSFAQSAAVARSQAEFPGFLLKRKRMASCIHQRFEYQARKYPEAVAVAIEGERLTYGKLNRQNHQGNCHAFIEHT